MLRIALRREGSAVVVQWKEEALISFTIRQGTVSMLVVPGLQYVIRNTEVRTLS